MTNTILVFIVFFLGFVVGVQSGIFLWGRFKT